MSWGRPPATGTVKSLAIQVFHASRRDRNTMFFESGVQVTTMLLGPHSNWRFIDDVRDEGEAFDRAAACRHDVDISIALVLAGEGDPLAVRRRKSGAWCRAQRRR